MKKRSPKTSFLTINISPTKTRQIPWQGRKRLRPMEAFRLGQFNELVKKSMISGLKFDSKGVLVGAEKTSPRLTKDQIQTIKRVVSITRAEKFKEEAQQESKIGKLNRKWNIFLREHEHRGQFQYIQPAMEIYLLKGKDPETLIRLTEMTNRKAFPELRELAAKFNTQQKIERNLTHELRYFEAYMKKRRITEMTICEEASMLDATTTKIKLTKEGVVRETFGKTIENSISTATEEFIKVTLQPNGKIRIRETTKELPPNTAKH